METELVIKQTAGTTEGEPTFFNDRRRGTRPLRDLGTLMGLGGRLLHLPGQGLGERKPLSTRGASYRHDLFRKTHTSPPKWRRLGEPRGNRRMETKEPGMGEPQLSGDKKARLRREGWETKRH